MKGLQWSLLAGIILTVVIVVIGLILVGPVAGFDPKKYFGLQPILGESTEGNLADIISPNIEEVKTRCGKFQSWKWSDSFQPFKTNPISTLLTIDKFISPNLAICPPSTVAVACATHPNFGSFSSDDGKKYGDDAIISIYYDNDSSSETYEHCVVEAKEGTFKLGQERQVGMLCASVEPNDVQYVWDDWSTSSGGSITIGQSLSCLAGFTAVSGMVQADTSVTQYAEDQIVNISQKSATIQDVSGDGINRKFGIVCLNNTVIKDCDIKEYDSPETENYKEWFDTTSLLFSGYAGWFTEQPCPGDSQVISCGGAIQSPDRYTLINSLDPTSLGDGTKSFNIQTCQLQYSFDTSLASTETVSNVVLCAEQLWHWSPWNTSSDSYPIFTGSTGAGDCPSGSQAIACASDTASLENGFGEGGTCGLLGLGSNVGGGKYGEDAISSIYFKTDATGRRGCIVRPWDFNDGLFKRRVGALCINDTYSNDFQWIVSATGEITTHRPTVTSADCPANWMPIFCTIEMNTSSEDYEKNGITGINIVKNPATNNLRCSMTFVNQAVDKVKGNIGVLCVNNTLSKAKINSGTQFISSSFENPFFEGQTPCTSGTATTALTIADPSDEAYTEDFLVSMVPESAPKGKMLPDNFVVEADDTTLGCPLGVGNEHSRKSGVACLNYPEDSFK